jgi:hypothetical protein
MKPYAILIHLDVFEHWVLSHRSGLKPFAMNRFDLEAVAPTFHGRIVVLIAFHAHAANQLVLLEQFLAVG